MHRPVGQLHEPGGLRCRDHPALADALTTVTGQLVEVHPTFLYESLWNLVGLLLIIFVVSKARRFDGENTWFYFLWYGIGRFWVEGLRTDSLYLFNWTIGGQPIQVSQALSLVMVFVSLFMLYYNIKLPSPQARRSCMSTLWRPQRRRPKWLPPRQLSLPLRQLH